MTIVNARCADLDCSSSENFAVDARDFTLTAGLSAPVTVPAVDHARSIRAAPTSASSVGIFFIQDAFPLRQAVYVERQAGIWQPPVALVGSGAQAFSSQGYPYATSFLTLLDGTIVFSYAPSSVQQYAATLSGGSQAFQLLSYTGVLGASAVGNEVFIGWPGGSLERRDAAGAYTTGSMITSLGDAASLWARSGGNFSVAQLDLFQSQSHGQAGDTLLRTKRAGGSDTTATIIRDGIGGAQPVEGAATPQFVWTKYGTGIVLSHYNGTTLVDDEIVTSSADTLGASPTALVSGTKRWVAHASPREAGLGSINVEYDSGTGFHPLGAVASGINGVSHVRLVQTFTKPALVWMSDTPSAINVQLWNGAAFDAPFSLATDVANFGLIDLAVIGDSSGPGGGGKLWVIVADAAGGQVEVVQLTASGELTATAGCDTCSTQVLNASIGRPSVEAIYDPSHGPTVLVADAESSFISRYVFSAGSWQATDLSATTTLYDLSASASSSLRPTAASPARRAFLISSR